MLGKYALLCAIICLLVAIPAMMLAQDPTVALTDAARALGAGNLQTIRFSATGSDSSVGQNRNPDIAWPVSRVKAYTREIDFESGTSQVKMIRVRGVNDVTVDQYVSSGSPWSSQYAFWITPFGFIKGALANDTSVSSRTEKDGTEYRVISFTLQDKYRVVGYINRENLVERVQTWIHNEVLGDMPVEVWYSEYRDFGGVKFPTMIIEKHGGFPASILSVSDVEPNAALNIAASASDTGAAAPDAIVVETETVADGVFYIKGGSHHSVAIEFFDHVVVIEAPLNGRRSRAVIEEVERLVPDKPIRYVVNTHHHFDHSGGLRTYAAEGAAIITHETNAAFLKSVLSGPRTLDTDSSVLARTEIRVAPVSGSMLLSDPARTLQLHYLSENPHHDGMLMAFLPAEKVLIEADVYTPSNPAVRALVNRATVNLVENVERLKLDFETILPLHGDAASRPALYAAVERPVPDILDILDPSSTEDVDARPAGVVLMERACTSCHGLARVTSQRRNRDNWRTVVVRMRMIGAQITDDETGALVDYLVGNYGL